MCACTKSDLTSNVIVLSDHECAISYVDAFFSLIPTKLFQAILTHKNVWWLGSFTPNSHIISCGHLAHRLELLPPAKRKGAEQYSFLNCVLLSAAHIKTPSYCEDIVECSAAQQIAQYPFPYCACILLFARPHVNL